MSLLMPTLLPVLYLLAGVDLASRQLSIESRLLGLDNTVYAGIPLLYEEFPVDVPALYFSPAINIKTC